MTQDDEVESVASDNLAQRGRSFIPPEIAGVIEHMVPAGDRDEDAHAIADTDNANHGFGGLRRYGNARSRNDRKKSVSRSMVLSSMISPFELAESQRKLNNHMSIEKRLAELICRRTSNFIPH
ncbi:MAG TPA: hypothetical protein VEZ20_03225 [Allosphingosinicella sp.]|nr:hypothetical protein [Allosphingosinicella sp.]